MTPKDVLGRGLSTIYVLLTLALLLFMALLLSLGHSAQFAVSCCGRAFGTSAG